MPAVNFQDNFGTNLTTNTSSGATTSPINSIPTVDAPFYIAFDATNLNSHYEVKLCNSKTATNVNHAATAYNHTTDEEVRLVQPAVHLNTMQNFHEGFLINGKIVPSVGSNNLTVAIKGMDGNDPSATNPVYCRIGNVVRSITSALSVAANAGQNYCNAGSAELATKEVDYFVYLTWDSVAGAVGLMQGARIPYANVVGDFAWSNTSEKGFLGTTTTNTATDTVVNIGRFAATLSAGAGYTWSVPTFTATNLVQRPIYETRWLDYVATPTWTGGAAPTGSPTKVNKYRLIGKQAFVSIFNYGYTPGTTNTKTDFVNPIQAVGALFPAFGFASTNNDINSGGAWVSAATTSVFYTSVSAERIKVMATYEI